MAGREALSREEIQTWMMTIQGAAENQDPQLIISLAPTIAEHEDEIARVLEGSGCEKATVEVMTQAARCLEELGYRRGALNFYLEAKTLRECLGLECSRCQGEIDRLCVILSVGDEDSDAFQILVTEYEGLLFGAIYSIVRNYHTTEDLLQNTFLQAWWRLNTLRDPTRFRAWVSRIAVNYACQWRRRCTLPMEGMESLRYHASGGCDQSMLVELDDLINSIPNWVDRSILLSHYLGGMLDREIAEQLGWKADTVKKRRQRCEAHLGRETAGTAEG